MTSKRFFTKQLLMGWIALALAGRVAFAAEEPDAAKEAFPVNRWVLQDTLPTKSKAFCATVYMPATDEFLLWGLPHGRYEVETFSVKTGKWELLKTEGESALSRDADYNSKHDTLMILGDRKWHVLDMEKLVWRTVDCPMPQAGAKWDSTMKYDPVHDVAVCLLPEKWGPMPVYLFRYDPKTAKYRDAQQKD